MKGGEEREEEEEEEGISGVLGGQGRPVGVRGITGTGDEGKREHAGEKSGDPSYHGALRGRGQNKGGLDWTRGEEWRGIGNHGVFSQQELRAEQEHKAGHKAQRDAEPGG